MFLNCHWVSSLDILNNLLSELHAQFHHEMFQCAALDSCVCCRQRWSLTSIIKSMRRNNVFSWILEIYILSMVLPEFKVYLTSNHDEKGVLVFSSQLNSYLKLVVSHCVSECCPWFQGEHPLQCRLFPGQHRHILHQSGREGKASSTGRRAGPPQSTKGKSTATGAPF